MGTPEASPERLFRAYLGELDRDESFDLAELLRRNPGREESLRALYDDWRRLRPLVEDARSVHASMAQSLGEQVDPTISLAESVDGERRDAAELLDELTRRASSKSRYRLEGEIARGGMGVVLKVFDGDLRRHLAMKVILGKQRDGAAAPAPPKDARVVSRFLEEAQVTGQLDHPSIVPVHELGLSSDGRVYFTMRLVRGRELARIFELAWSGDEGWNLTRALGVVLKACEAVAYAHAKGVVHRDLKPANVMVGRFGEVYVMDWGLARVVGSPDRHDLRLDVDPAKYSEVITDRSETPGGDSPLRTMDGDIIGTPTYMAPEQALGHLAEVGRHSDVYSIGAMLYHLLARTPPYVFPGEKATQKDVLTRLCVGAPEPLHVLAPRTPAELISICEKAMSRQPDERYANVQELAEDLRAYLENRVVRAYRTGPIVELRKWVRRNRALAASLAVAVGLALGGATSVTWIEVQAKERITRTLEEKERINGELSSALNRIAAAEGRLTSVNNELSNLEQEKVHLFAELGETKRKLEVSGADKLMALAEQQRRSDERLLELEQTRQRLTELESQLQREKSQALDEAQQVRKDVPPAVAKGLEAFEFDRRFVTQLGYPVTMVHKQTGLELRAVLDSEWPRLYVSKQLVGVSQFTGNGADRTPETSASAVSALEWCRARGLDLLRPEEWALASKLIASDPPKVAELLLGSPADDAWPTRTPEGKEGPLQPSTIASGSHGFRVVFRLP